MFLLGVIIPKYLHRQSNPKFKRARVIFKVRNFIMQQNQILKKILIKNNIQKIKRKIRALFRILMCMLHFQWEFWEIYFLKKSDIWILRKCQFSGNWKIIFNSKFPKGKKCKQKFFLKKKKYGEEKRIFFSLLFL